MRRLAAFDLRNNPFKSGAMLAKIRHGVFAFDRLAVAGCCEDQGSKRYRAAAAKNEVLQAATASGFEDACFSTLAYPGEMRMRSP